MKSLASDGEKELLVTARRLLQEPSGDWQVRLPLIDKEGKRWREGRRERWAGPMT